jgi:hypothetical protein
MLLTIGLTGIALTIATVGAATAAAGAIGSGVVATNNAVKNKRSALLEGAKARRLEKQLEALEQSRQPVIDQSQKIRNLKNQVNNPYANLGVAMQSANLQMEQTDQALANTLETINATGMGAGGASALAKAAAQSKAGIAASIETQEANNQKLRIEGEQKAQDTKINIEKQALAEEVAAFERQDERDVSKMNRLAGLQDRAQQNQMMYQQAAQEQSMQAMGAVTDLGTSMMSMAGGMPGGGGGGGGVPGVAPPTGGGLYGYGDAPAGTTSAMTDQGAMSMAPSDRRLKKNIKYIGNSDSGLKIYTFEYIDKKGVYKGVMSDEVPSNAITKDVNGYDLVDYSKIDVEFEKVK